MGKSRGADFDRKFDEWEWCDRTVTSTSFKFEVRYRSPENTAKGTPTFYIQASNPAIAIEDGDLGALRNKLDTAIREAFVRDWKRYLLVKYAAGTLSGHAEIMLDVTVYEISRGSNVAYRQVRDPDFDVDDGSDRSRGWTGYGGIVIIPADADVVDVIIAKSRGYNEEGTEIALLDDTPENRAALLKLIEATQLLSDRLGDLLKADEIQRTLTKITLRRLALPAAPHPL